MQLQNLLLLLLLFIPISADSIDEREAEDDEDIPLSISRPDEKTNQTQLTTPDVTFIKQCKGTCLPFQSTILLYLSDQITPYDRYELEKFFEKQINDCSAKNFKQISMNIYMPRSNQWVTCCSIRSCTKRVLTISWNKVILPAIQKDHIDIADIHRMVRTTKEVLTWMKDRPPSHSIFLITDYVVNGFPNIHDDRLQIIFVQSKETYFDTATLSSYFAGNNVISPLSATDTINTICSAEPFLTGCINNTAPVQPEMPPLDVRIYLSLGNGTIDSDLATVIMFLDTILVDRHSLRDKGSIIINGPRGVILASCQAIDSFKCIMELRETTLEEVNVFTPAINLEDIDFAPDVLSFMRMQAIQETSQRKTIVMILSNFVSAEFSFNSFFFEKAVARQNLVVFFTVILHRDGLTRNDVINYYGNISGSQDIIALDTYANLSDITQRIMNSSYLITEEPPPLFHSSTIAPFNTRNTQGSSIQTTDTSDHFITTQQQLTTTREVDNSFDLIIALSLSNITSDDELADLRHFLRRTIDPCSSNGYHIAIVDNGQVRYAAFCSGPKCLDMQIEGINRATAVRSQDMTVQELNDCLDLLNPPSDSDEDLPSLFLITNFASETFMESYDRNDENIRLRLSNVDFQMILINSTNLYRQSSLPSKQIKQFTSFKSLLNAPNPFCYIKDDGITKHRISPKILWPIVTVSIIILIIIILFATKLFTFVQNLIRKNRISEIKLEKNPIIENEYTVGMEALEKQTILNVSGYLSNPDPWEMSRHLIYKGKEIGVGFTASVFQGSIVGRAPVELIHKKFFFAYQYENTTVAIKMCHSTADDIAKRQLMDEIKTLKRIEPHKNIANLLGCVTTSDPICMVIEYASNGSLKRYLKGKSIIVASALPCSKHSPNEICWRDAISFLWQIADAMSYLVSCGLLHRDLAARNVLVRQGRDVVLSDFGLAIWKDELPIGRVERLPVKWTAPEALKGRHFTEKSDVWSFGICAWEICSCGMEPYCKEAIGANDMINRLNRGERAQQPYGTDQEVWDIILSCWDISPSCRPSFSSIRSELGSLLSSVSQCYGYLPLSNQSLIYEAHL